MSRYRDWPRLGTGLAAGQFRGVVAGEVYTDHEAFEKAARDYGFRADRQRAEACRTRLGVNVRAHISGRTLTGQVWARCEADGFVWIAMEDGHYYALQIGSGAIYEGVNGQMRGIGDARQQIGRLAS